MLHVFEFAPFADAGRQRQFAALHAALLAEGPFTGVLLANPAPGELALDALLVLPHALVLVLLVPEAGHLQLPAASAGAWQLGAQWLPALPGGPNPLSHYQQQLPAAQRWVAAQLACPEAALPPGLGLVVFEAPLTFAPDVEQRLHQAAPAAHLELLGDAAGLPQRLRTLPTIPYLAAAELAAWATGAQPLAAEATEADTPVAYLLAKLRQLGQWLGAADVPPDPPYGSATAPSDAQEQARLQAFRQELQAELRQHRQEAAAREAAYQRELLRLQQQVLQAGTAASAQQPQAAEAASQAARAELAARSEELNQRIAQLGQLIGRLQAAALGAPRPAARPTASSPTRRAAPPRPGTRPALGWSQLRPAERWVLLSVALAGAGLATWRLTHAPPRRPPPVATQRARPSGPTTEAALPGRVYVVDSSLAPPSAPDTLSLAWPAAAPVATRPNQQTLPSSWQGDTVPPVLDNQPLTPAATPAPPDSAE